MIRPLFVCLFASAAFVLSAQTIYPYLQSPTPSSIWVTWITQSGTESQVFFGDSADNLNQSATGAHHSIASNHIYHKVLLDGLNSNQYYYYKIKTGAEESGVYRFQTQPADGQGNPVYRVLIMGDHQILAASRYDSLVVRAKRFIENSTQQPIEDYIDICLNVGDQVDVSTTEHWRELHYKKSRYISGNIPIMPIAGNHEYYGTLGIQGYRDHFELDAMQYANIPSNTENYYAFQTGRILYIMTDTQSPSTTQKNWIQQVIDHASTDATVDWIIVEGHHPLVAEQYVGDISVWLRDEILPILQQTDKTGLIVTAHHHLYARGQIRDFPIYQIISGGTAWDQLWGDSQEVDFEDVQKTIDYWPFQVVEFDVENQSMHVKSYAIGNVNIDLGVEMIDEFHRIKGQDSPLQPSIVTVFPDSISLPYWVESSPYESPVNELLNSSQFQISQDSSFAVTYLDKLRNFENLYGTTGAPLWDPVDVNAFTDILELLIPENAVPNGEHLVRVRHRDRNLNWSSWSESLGFRVYGSTADGNPFITADKTVYQSGETISVTYQNGPGNPTDWIGLYKKGDVPGNVGSTVWSYVQGSAGSLNFSLSQVGEYFIAFFENDGYIEIANRIPIFVGNTPVLIAQQEVFPSTSSAVINYTQAPALPGHWIGVYKTTEVPGEASAAGISNISTLAGAASFSSLADGFYFASYFINQDNYLEISDRAYFRVGQTPAALNLDKDTYILGDTIWATFSNGAGHPKDWLAIFEAGADPQSDPLIGWTYVDGQSAGSVALYEVDSIGTNNEIPLEPGEYFIVLNTNDSYDEISNRVYFDVVDPNVDTRQFEEKAHFSIRQDRMNGYLMVSGDRIISELQLFSVQGIPLSHKHVNGKEATIHTKSLPKMLFFLLILDEKGQRHCFKFIP